MASNKMDESNLAGRNTPGLGSKPATPVPQQGVPNAMVMSGQPGSMPPSSMAPNATSHGAVRYGYSPHGPQMHPNGPYGSMGPQSNHPGMGHHGFSHGSYGPNHQMHPSQQSQQGGQYGMPMMMPPPSQPQPYPNKSPMSQPPPGVSPSGPSPHHSMMPSDRSSMSYYGSRFSGPPAQPPHHSQPASPHQQQQNPYYMRPPMGQQQGGKNFYPNSASTPHGPHGYGPNQAQPGGMSSQIMMAGQHSHHHQQQHHQMMIHHHQLNQMQQQQHAGYGPMGAHMGEIGPTTTTTTSLTHTTASSALSNHGGDNLRHPQPPSIMDEVSQTSTASSQAADDSCASTDMPISSHKAPNKHHLSHPSTPNTSNLGSPGAASLSSFHDDFDSVSSPSWPRTPASPALNSSQFSVESHHHSSSKRSDSIQKLYEMSDEPDRKVFLDKFLQFQEERGCSLTQVPTISKIPLDLYRLYLSVRERGGFSEVTKAKLWKECAQLCNIANSSSAAYTLRKQYMKHMLHFECKFDRGGIDPGPVLMQLDAATNSKKKSNSSKASASNSSTPTTTPRLSPSDTSGQSYHHSMPPSGPHSGYENLEQHGSYPPSASVVAAGQHSGPPYHQMSHPQAQFHHTPEFPYPPHSGSGHMPPPPPPLQHSMPNAPPQSSSGPASAPNHNESVSVKDPFADDDQTSSTSMPSPASNYPTRPHYSIPPGSQGPYFNQMPPSSQAQSQHHPSNYPDGQPAHSQSSHYPIEGQYPRSSSAAPTTSESASNQMHSQYSGYPSRMSASVNGPSSHGYYAGHGPPQQQSMQAQQQQQIAYEQTGHQQGTPHHQRPSFDGHHGPRSMTPSSHEHYSGHGQSQHQPLHPHAGPMHRFPMTNSAHPNANAGMSSGFAPRGPYSSSQPPHQPSPSGQMTPQQAASHAQASQHQQQHQHSQQPQPPQSQSSYSTSQESFPKNSETYNAAPRMQSPLAQRLLAAKESHTSAQQSYPVNQPQSLYSNAASSSGAVPPTSSSSKTTPPTGAHHSASSSSYPPIQQQANSNISWMSSTSRYGQPKRHPDFAKSTTENFPMHGPYQQYPNFPGANPSPKSTSASGQPWIRDGSSHQYRMSSPSQFMQGHPQYSSNPSQHASSREPWHESRSPSVPPPSSSAADTPPGQSGPNWPSNRYPSGYSGSMHEQYGNSPQHSPHYSQAQHGMSNSQKMVGFNNRTEPAVPNYMPPMIHPQGGHSPAKMALSNQLAERRGAFPHGTGVPPLYMATGQQHAMMKREVNFPPNSVEATVPTPTKHRKLAARDKTVKGPVDAWRLFMSLKSGLLAESTFALDILNVYSNDDSTLIYLGLTNMPGLLEVLLEHYKCYLNEMFDNLFDDTEIGYEARQLRHELDGKFGPKRSQKVSTGKKRKLKWYELRKDYSDEEKLQKKEESEEDDEHEEEMGLFFEKHFKSRSAKQLVLTNTTNYTHITRTGQPVTFKRSKSLFISDYEKSWDQIKNGFASGYEHWAKGGGETTSHIVSHFEPKENYLRLVRVMKTEKSVANGFTEGENEKMGVENDVPEEEFCEDSFVAINGNYPKIRDSDRDRYWKKQHQPEYEEESYDQEESPIVTGRDYQESIKSRVLTLSNLIRNLTFVPGNDLDMVKHPGLLLVLSRLILLHHVHAIKKKPKSSLNLEKITSIDDNSLFNLRNSEEKAVPEQMTENEWFCDALHLLRENTLVTLANLSGQLDLSPFPEQISLNIIDGILHWATCPSSYAQDSLPAAHSSLSPKRLAYETLTKLSIYENNVDLILATPPWERMEKFLSNLIRALGRHEEQTMREFSVVLLSNFSNESTTARAIALIGNAIPLLLAFIEQAEQSALHVVNTQGYQALRENPELMGTTLDMIRRSASTLRNISRVAENRGLFVQYEQRLLALVMSQILDQSVAAIVADILYESSFVSAQKQLLADRLAKEALKNANTTIVAKGSSNNNNKVLQERICNQKISPNEDKNDATLASADANSESVSKNLADEEQISGETKTTLNGPQSVDRAAIKSADSDTKSIPDCKEKVQNETSLNKVEVANSPLAMEPVKQCEPSNGFEHKVTVNQNHSCGLTKNESNSLNRVSNGVLTNLSHNENSKTSVDNAIRHAHKNVFEPTEVNSVEKSYYSSGYNLHNNDFYSGRKGVLPQGSPVLVTEKQANHANFYTSPYSSTNLAPSGKSISSNGVMNSATGNEHKDQSLPGSVDSSDNKKSVANELNSQAVPPGTATAAVIEASST